MTSKTSLNKDLKNQASTTASVRTAKKYPALEMPLTVNREKITIWSDGVALDGDIYRPNDLGGGRLAPAVVMSHGLGGNKSTAERYAAKFAQAGMIALCFSHAGWGDSGNRLVLMGEPPTLDQKNECTARVRAVRELVDPLEWIQNYRSAVDYIEGEPHVDRDRIGAWGTSYGGGIAMHNAANDKRIKALVVQVAYVAGIRAHLEPLARRRAIELARGLIAFPPQTIDCFPSTPGTPHWARTLQYNALEELGKIAVPVLMMDAEKEEMFDIRENCGKAYQILRERGTTPVEYKIIKGINHYGIYFDGFQEGSNAACEWLMNYL